MLIFWPQQYFKYFCSIKSLNKNWKLILSVKVWGKRLLIASGQHKMSHLNCQLSIEFFENILQPWILNHFCLATLSSLTAELTEISRSRSTAQYSNHSSETLAQVRVEQMPTRVETTSDNVSRHNSFNNNGHAQGGLTKETVSCVAASHLMSYILKYCWVITNDLCSIFRVNISSNSGLGKHFLWTAQIWNLLTDKTLDEIHYTHYTVSSLLTGILAIFMTNLTFRWPWVFTKFWEASCSLQHRQTQCWRQSVPRLLATSPSGSRLKTRYFLVSVAFSFYVSYQPVLLTGKWISLELASNTSNIWIIDTTEKYLDWKNILFQVELLNVAAKLSFTPTVIIIHLSTTRFSSTKDTETSSIFLIFTDQVLNETITCMISDLRDRGMTIKFKFMEFPHFVKDWTSFVLLQSSGKIQVSLFVSNIFVVKGN